MNIKRNIQLLFEIGCFRFLDRNWKRMMNPDFQNNTEHSYRTAWLALMISKMEGVGDHAKILKMAILHDLPESRTNDVDYLSRQYVIRNEDMALVDIFASTILEEEMNELWKEYEERKSIESRIVKDADNLDVDLELREQSFKGVVLEKVWHRQRAEAVYSKLFTKSAKLIWREIQKSNPHDWHLQARNRFNDGDWKDSNKKKST